MAPKYSRGDATLPRPPYDLDSAAASRPAGHRAEPEATTFLSLRGLSKVFAGQWALADLDLEFKAGEIHAVVGKNGSGKSTLIKILSGFHSPEPGAEAFVGGAPFELGSARHAHEAGFRFIHQDLGLAGSLSIVDNLALGASYAGRYWLSERAERRRARRILLEHGMDLDVTLPVENLSPAQQSMVAIIRAIHDLPEGNGLLVLDEPTASLPERDVEHLFGLLRRARERGLTVVYVTHRLPEVLALADRVTVLRDGRRITTTNVDRLDHDELVELIVGHQVENSHRTITTGTGSGRPALAVARLSGGPLNGVSFNVRPGEILGMTGLIGSGYEAVLGMIFGGVPRDGGRIEVAGRELRGGPRAAITAGLAYVSADRKRLGSIQSWTLRENLTLPAIPRVGRTPLLNRRADGTEAATWLKRLEVEPADPERLLSSLSGGNQQRVVLGKWLRRGSRVFLLDEPTIGVDVGAKERIYALLRQAARDGAAVVMASSDLEELEAVCSRVLVLRDGQIACDVTGAAVSADRLFSESVGVNAGPIDAGFEEAVGNPQ
jgi:ribose transport system ATP-binding protein